jgi:hypothetical protein
VLLAVREIPDWKARYEFWAEAARSIGGLPAMLAESVGSTWLSPSAAAFAVAWLIFVGEPKRGLRSHWLPYLGWLIVAAFTAAIIGTAMIGAVEIYVKKEVSARDVAIQKQSAVRPVVWHLTDFQRTALTEELRRVPEDQRFQINVQCLPDAGSRTFVEDIGKVFLDQQWKINASCMFSNIRPDLTGLKLAVSEKYKGKAMPELPKNVRTLAEILIRANIEGEFAINPDLKEDDFALAIGNAP